MWKRIGENECLSSSGLMRIVNSGHGRVKGTYRKPDINSVGTCTYRITVDGQVRRLSVEKLLLHIFGVTLKCDRQWYDRVCLEVMRRNIIVRIRYRMERPLRDRLRNARQWAKRRYSAGQMDRYRAELVLGSEEVKAIDEIRGVEYRPLVFDEEDDYTPPEGTEFTGILG